MRHVDDGTIHAWLDGQVSDPAETAWIEHHCQTCSECAARLADERAMLAQADALLSSIAPATEADRSSYEALVARATRTAGGSGPSASSTAPARFRTWQLAAGWAASVLFAATLGWMVRDDGRSGEQMSRLASSEAPPRAGAAVTSTADLAAPTLETTAPERGQPSTPPADLLAQPRASTPSSAGGASDRGATESAQRPLAAASSTAAGGAPSARAQSAEEAFAATAKSAVRSALPAPAQPPVGSVPLQQLTPGPPPYAVPDPAGGAPRPAAVPPPRLPSPAPVAATPFTGAGGTPLGRGGGGRGGRGAAGSGAGGGSGAGVGAPSIADADSARAVVVEPSAPAVSSLVTAETAASQGRLMVDGSTTARTEIASAPSTVWRPMPRTEAAARTGMALYGITGLTPSATMLSADGTIVRTIYETEPGEAIEIWQQRTPSPGAAGRGSLGGQTLNRAADTFTGSWTAVFGDVQVTLRGGAGVASWGERLRVE